MQIATRRVQIVTRTPRRSSPAGFVCAVPFAVCTLALPACTVGPDYRPPAAAAPGGYVGAGSPEGLDASGLPTTPTSRGPVESATRWWEVLRDTRLTSLIDRAALGNLTLDQARARVQQARAAVLVAEADLAPTVSLGSSATRSRSGGGGGIGGGRTGNVFRAGFDASWEIDVFGGIRRRVEASEADLRAAVEDQRAAWVTVAAEVANTYVQLRGGQARLAYARKNLEAQTRTLGLTRELFEAGYVGGLDVANSSAQVETTLARIPPLETQVRQNAFALAVLVGREPAALLEELTPDAPVPEPPREVPVGLPSELLRRRPDIRRAEAALNAATARIGVAVSDLFPRFTLGASLGTQGPRAGDLGTLDSRTWSVGPSVDWTLFDAGRRRANIEIQDRAAGEAFAAYQQTVLVSLQEVESALVALTKEQARRRSVEAAVAANRDAVRFANELYQAGRTDFLNVLNAERQLLDSEDALAQSQTAVTAAVVQLYKALGGGWAGNGLTDPAPERR